jgi:hypothetical protein
VSPVVKIREAMMAGGGQDDGKMTDNATTVETDEQTFILSAAWRKLVFPRRGGVPGPSLSADSDRGEELVRAAKATIETRLAHPGSDRLANAWIEAEIRLLVAADSC